MGQLTLQPATGVDSYLSESAQTANFGATDNIVAGNIHATGVDYSHRIVLQFDATALPADASVSSAVLTLDAISGTGISNTTFTAHRVTSTWTHLGVTWLTRDGSTAWTSAGGDYVALAADTTTAATSTSDLVFSSLAALVTDAIQNRSGIVYVMVKGPEDTGASSFLNLVSSHNATGEKPKLVIGYFLAGEGLLQYVTLDGPIEWTNQRDNPMSPAPPQIETKQAAESLPITFGFALRIGNNAAGTAAADPIASATIASSPSGLTISSAVVNASSATVEGVTHFAGHAVGALVSGGTAGVDYELTCTATTTAGAIHKLGPCKLIVT